MLITQICPIFMLSKIELILPVSGLSEVKKSDIDIAVNIAGEVYSAYRRVTYENSEPWFVLQFCRRQVGIVFYGNLLNRDG